MGYPVSSSVSRAINLFLKNNFLGKSSHYNGLCRKREAQGKRGAVQAKAKTASEAHQSARCKAALHTVGEERTKGGPVLA